MAKEAYLYGKRGLLQWTQIPIHMAGEANSYGKRGLFIWQKRPIHMAKETYSYGKRDLFIWQKRPAQLGGAADTLAEGFYARLWPRGKYFEHHPLV